MIKVDLITGFLGAGKTTFLLRYAKYLMAQGMKIGILVYDHGAVNVDLPLLKELRGEQCELEMLAGGCDPDCHRRRFRSKLIAMGMSGYDRVIIEPSGVFDMDEYYDTLNEQPLDRWYEAGSVIAVVDAKLSADATKEEDFFLASQAASAGCVLLSRVQFATDEEITEILEKTAGGAAVIRAGLAAPPFWKDPDSPEIEACMKAYREVTGEDAKPFSIGGGTYARHFPNAVAFGPEHQGRPRPAFAGSIHGAEEAASEAELLESLKIYILALLGLEQLDFA